MLGVVVVYLGLIATFLGGVSLLRPLTFLAIHSRRQAALILALGFIVVVIGESLPAKEIRVATPRTQLAQPLGFPGQFRCPARRPEQGMMFWLQH